MKKSWRYLSFCILAIVCSALALPASADVKSVSGASTQATAPIAPEILFFILKGDAASEDETVQPADTDGDGVADTADQCANTPPGAGADGDGCADSQLDSDNDTVSNDVDQCPATPTDDTADTTGCSPSQLDTDNDGVTDDLDQCPNTSSGANVDVSGCATSQLDTDSDGVTDNLDQCPNTAAGADVDADGCSDSQLDSDNDTVSNDVDQCPATPTDETADSTGCSPSQLDTDNDGVTDDLDQCPTTSPGVAVDDSGCEDTSGSLKDDYIQNVNPLITDFQRGCTSSGCHGKGNAPGGLSLYGSNVAGSDHLNYDSLVSYIDRRSVTRLLGKLSGTLGHGGGVRYGTGTSGYQVIKTWAEAVEAQ